MNVEIIIREQVKLFFQTRRDFEHRPNGASEFKEELGLKLYDFEESIDKLMFLYEVKKIIAEKIEQHKPVCNFNEDGICPKELAWQSMIYFLEQEIKLLNPQFEYSVLRPHVNSDIINENLISLGNYPGASQAYIEAIDKFNQGNLERNLLDDLRLSLELLLQSILQNNKSIENQSHTLGKLLKENKISPEIRNMFTKLIDYFSKYQNNYIKHDSNVKQEEVDLLINLTSTFISFIINLNS